MAIHHGVTIPASIADTVRSEKMRICPTPITNTGMYTA